MATKSQEQIDKQLHKMEQHLTEIFTTESKELNAKWKEYTDKMKPKLNAAFDAMNDAVLSGDTDAQTAIGNAYSKMLDNYTLKNKHFKQLINDTAFKLSHVNQIALDYVNEQMASVFTLGYNGLATDSPIKGYSFDLVDEYTVKELAAHNGSLLPHKTVDKYKDVAWNKKAINGQVLQGILQGESIDKIANRLQNVTDMNKASAIRNARTMTTCAENKGRQASYTRASQDGVKMKKIWLSAGNDGRTRATHLQAGADYADGIAVTMKFNIGASELLYPGDPAGEPCEVYNCRCTMITHVDGFKPSKELTHKQKLDDSIADDLDTADTPLEQIDVDSINTATKLQDVTTATIDEINAAKEDVEYYKHKMNDIGSETVSGIWKNDVKVSDYSKVKDSISAKDEYYTQKINELEEKQSAGTITDYELIKLEQLKSYQTQLMEYSIKGKEYEQLKSQYDTSLAYLNEITPKSEMKGSFSNDAFSDEVKSKALAFSDRDKADSEFHRPYLDSIWDNVEDKEKYAVWEYTRNSNPINKSLSGYHDSWSRSSFIGMDKTDWGHEDSWRSIPSEFAQYGKDGRVTYHGVITNLTNAIDKSELPNGCMLVRGSDKGGLAGLLEGDLLTFSEASELVNYGSIDDIRATLKDQVFYNHAFTSTGIAVNAGFGGNVKYEIYAPQGTHAMYAEPQSYYGRTIDDAELYKKGQSYHSVGSEAEVIIQRGTGYRITDVEDNHGTLVIKMEVVDQPTYFKYGDEDTYNRGETRHTK